MKSQSKPKLSKNVGKQTHMLFGYPWKKYFYKVFFPLFSFKRQYLLFETPKKCDTRRTRWNARLTTSYQFTSKHKEEKSHCKNLNHWQEFELTNPLSKILTLFVGFFAFFRVVQFEKHHWQTFWSNNWKIVFFKFQKYPFFRPCIVPRKQEWV